MIKVSIPDSTITREMLVPKLRRPSGTQNALTKVFLSSGTTGKTSAILSYEATQAQSVVIGAGQYGYLQLSLPTGLLPNGDVVSSPFIWTSDASRNIMAMCIATFETLCTGLVLALRVNGRDMTTTHLVQYDNTLIIVQDLAIDTAEQVTVEMRGFNALDSNVLLTATSAALIIKGH